MTDPVSPTEPPTPPTPAEPAGPAPLAWPVTAAAPAAPKRHVGLIIGIIVAVVVVVLGGAGGAAAVFLHNRPTGAKAVQAFFDRLAEGDVPGALTHVLPVDAGFDRYPLLTSAVLADPTTRPAGLAITGTQRQTDSGTITELVTVTYTIAGTPYNQILRAIKQADGSFQLKEPFLDLYLEDVADRTITINGVDATSLTRTNAYAVPGAYRVHEDATAAFEESAATITADSHADGSPVELPDEVTVDVPLTLGPGAQDLVQKAVDDYLDICLQSHSISPTTVNPNGKITPCPYRLGPDDIPVTWSYSSYPTISLSIIGRATRTLGVEVSIKTKTEGVAGYSSPGYIPEQFTFSFVGDAWIKGDTVSVESNYQVD